MCHQRIRARRSAGPRARTSKVGEEAGHLVQPAPFPILYSPEYVEGVFSEIRLQDAA